MCGPHSVAPLGAAGLPKGALVRVPERLSLIGPPMGCPWVSPSVVLALKMASVVPPYPLVGESALSPTGCEQDLLSQCESPSSPMDPEFPVYPMSMGTNCP